MADETTPRDLTRLTLDTASEVKLLVEALFQVIALAINPFPVRGREDAISILTNTVPGLVRSIAQNLGYIFRHTVGGRAKDLAPLAKALAGDLDGAITSAIGTGMAAILNYYEGAIKGTDTTTAAGAKQAAGALLAKALELGTGAHLLAMLPELAYFTKNLGLSQTAAMVAELAGFAEVIKASHGPFLSTALHRPSTYSFNREYQNALPEIGAAGEMWARRKTDDAGLLALMRSAGMTESWIDPLSLISYRRLQPFVLASAYQNAEVPVDQVRAAVEDAGYSPDNVNLIIDIVQRRSLQKLREAYVQKASGYAGLGYLTLDELDAAADEATYGAEAKMLIRKLTLLEQRATTAKETEAAAKLELEGNLITATQADDLMAAAGVDDWKRKLEVTLGSTRAALKAALKFESEARAIARKTMAAVEKALLAQYADGTIDEITLTAGLAAALENYLSDLATLGQTPDEIALERTLGLTLIAAQVSQATAARKGRPVYTFGLLLSRADAVLLKERVAALKEAVTKADLDTATALAELKSLGIPDSNAQALVDEWTLVSAKKGSSPLGPGQPSY
jgi:hypothetical protein